LCKNFIGSNKQELIQLTNFKGDPVFLNRIFINSSYIVRTREKLHIPGKCPPHTLKIDKREVKDSSKCRLSIAFAFSTQYKQRSQVVSVH